MSCALLGAGFATRSGMAAETIAATQLSTSHSSQSVATQRLRPAGRSEEPSRSPLPKWPTTSTESGEHSPVAVARPTPTIATLLLRVQREYHEMPGLKLTEAQARRLWNLDGGTCSRVLTTLLEQRFLRRTTSGTYVRATV